MTEESDKICPIHKHRLILRPFRGVKKEYCRSCEFEKAEKGEKYTKNDRRNNKI